MAFEPCDCRPDRREAVGEGHIFTTMLRPICLPLAMRRVIAGIPMLPRSRLSEAFGVGQSPMLSWVSKFGVLRSRSDGQSPRVASDDFSVGKSRDDPDAITDVGCVKGGSRKAMPFRIVPERGQVSENGSEVGPPVDAKEV